METTFLKSGDTKPSYQKTLTDASDLTGATVKFRMRELNSNALKVNGTCTIVDGPGRVVRYDWTAGSVNTPGVYLCEWGVTYADGSQQTIPNDDTYDRVIISKRLP